MTLHGIGSCMAARALALQRYDFLRVEHHFKPRTSGSSVTAVARQRTWRRRLVRRDETIYRAAEDDIHT